MRHTLIALLLVACGTTTPIDASERLTTENTASPLRPIDALTTIRVRYPNADIVLRGSVAPLSWDADFEGKREGDEVVFEVPAEDFEYKPVIRGPVWAQGRNYTSKETAVAPRFYRSEGRIHHLYDGFYSNVLGNTRHVYAYLPPSYDENAAASYPLLVMHDGQNLFDPRKAFGGNEWKVDETLNQGISEGWLPEIIVLGVDNTRDRMGEYTPTRDAEYGGGDADAYLRFLTEELLVEARKHLRIKPGPENTGIMGSSLGGLVSVYAGKKRSDVFGLVGAMSPSTWWDDRYILGAVKEGMPRLSRVYVDSGNSGPSKDDEANTRELAAALRAQDLSVEHVVQDGASHSEVYWAQRLGHALWFLFQVR